MAISSVWCCLLEREVARISNREDETIAVVCPDFQVATGLCHLKTSAVRNGLVLERHDQGQQDLIDGAVIRCRFA